MYAVTSLASAIALLVFAAGTASAAPPVDCGGNDEPWGPSRLSGFGKAVDDGRLTIVAMGSSSTAGAGASAAAATYPAQLQEMLRARFPGTAIAVLNRGVGGDTVEKNLARFDHDVLAEHPDLTIWQVGTNDALKGVAAQTVHAELLDGIARLRAIGSDVVLMDMQYMPVRESAALDEIRETIAAVGVEAGVPVLRRHDLMRRWIQTGLFQPATMLSADNLHMTDASYRCLATSIAALFPSDATAFGGGEPVIAKVSGAPAKSAAIAVTTPAS